MADIFKTKKIRNFGSLITDPFHYIRRHFKVLGKSILYFVVPLVVVASVMLSQYATESFDVNPEAINSGSFWYDIMVSSSSGTLFALLAMTALAAVVYNHMKLVADDNIPNDSIQVEDIWEGFKSDFFMILVLSVGVFFATLFGFIFFIIPGIFISVKLTLVTTVYVIEDRGLGESFSRSWNLITNHWWFTLGLVIVVSILVSLMSYGISLPFVIISAFSGFAGLDNPETASTTFGMIYGLTTSLSYIFYTVLYLSLGLHYFNLVERKEGQGLQQRIQEIDSASNV